MFKPATFAVFAFGVLAGVGTASAAEVERKAELKGDATAIWAKVGGWCALADFHPAVAKCEEGSAGGKKTRTLTTKDGAVIKETMLEAGATSYSYRIDESPLPVADYTASFALTKSANGATLTWSTKFQPKGASEAEAEKVIQGIFDGGLENLKKTYK
jgi:hypothetical protein